MPTVKKHIWYNGQFFPADQPILLADNRAFAFGDGLYETIYAYGTEAKHLGLHLSRLTEGMKQLGMEIPSYLNESVMGGEVTRLLNKLRVFDGARVKLSVFRKGAGAYAPQTHEVGVILQAIALSSKFYQYNQKGLVVDVFTELRKPINTLSGFKTCSSLLNVMAGLFVAKMGVDDCLLINEQNRIAEASSSNLFLVRGNTLITPSLSEGCVSGVMRKLIIERALAMGINVIDDALVEPDLLLKADEMFFTNAIAGIKWIVGFQQRRYLGRVSKQLSESINRFTFPNQFREGFSG